MLPFRKGISLHSEGHPEGSNRRPVGRFNISSRTGVEGFKMPYVPPARNLGGQDKGVDADLLAWKDGNGKTKHEGNS